MTPEEKQTWDLLTWVNEVDESTLDYDVVDECLTWGELRSGKELTDEQLELYAKYKPEVLEKLEEDRWDYESQYYEDFWDDEDQAWYNDEEPAGTDVKS